MAMVVSPPEQRIILENISWNLYEQLLAEHGDSVGTRFTYDNGDLEIMVVSAEHERFNRTLALLVDLIAAELDINVDRVGSNTFKRADLLKGFEPDSCFYTQHHAHVKGKKRLDLSVDPPPDLVIEVDVTSPSLPRFPIFAGVGVPEVWRYDGERVWFFKLEGEKYAEVEHSPALPPLTSDVATRFLKENEEMDSTDWLRRVRGWARQTSVEGE